MDEVIRDLPGVRRVVDDLLIFAATPESLLSRTSQLFERCRQFSVTLKLSKSDIFTEETTFCGYVLSKSGIQISPDITSGISQFPVPQNISDLRSFFGLVNQVAHFSTKVSEALEPLRPLLSTKNLFSWTDLHDAAFSKAKSLLESPLVLVPFDPKRKTRINTDASRLHGLGFTLEQLVDHQWRLVMAGSRFITETESRYAMIELEALAVTWAMQKCRLYLLGLPVFELRVDHMPLVPILNKMGINDIQNPRLQRLKMKLLPYSFNTVWIKGSDHKAADALSRSPVDQPNDDDLICEKSIELHVKATFADYSLKDVKLESIILEQSKDSVLCKLSDYVMNGWPSNFDQCDSVLKPYWQLRHQISVMSDVLVMNNRVIIPPSLRPGILSKLHLGHQGIEKTRALARETVYWPGIDKDVELLCKSCSVCVTKAPRHVKEPLISVPLPTRPWDKIGADFITLNDKKYLITVDYFSNYVEVHNFHSNPTGLSTVQRFKNLFARYGAPFELITDGGSEFCNAHFVQFCKEWQFIHTVSSPTHAQSNGKAESAVKNVKNLLLKCGGMNDAFWHGLLQLRNTPMSHGKSPAELMFGRQLNDHFPRFPHFHETREKFLDDVTKERISENRSKEKVRYDRGSHSLKPLSIGQRVAIRSRVDRDWSLRGTVIEKKDFRVYVVETDSGAILVRNRRYLRTIVPGESSYKPFRLRHRDTSNCDTIDTPVCDNNYNSAPNDPPTQLRRSQRNRRAPQYLNEYVTH